MKNIKYPTKGLHIFSLIFIMVGLIGLCIRPFIDISEAIQLNFIKIMQLFAVGSILLNGIFYWLGRKKATTVGGKVIEWVSAIWVIVSIVYLVMFITGIFTNLMVMALYLLCTFAVAMLFYFGTQM